jgi:CheY-like chemotaxis protein
MREQVRLDGLLFTNDAEVIGVMSEILKSFSIEATVHSDLKIALDAVTQRRLDIVVVDWNGGDPTRVVRDTRKSSPNRNSTIVAMVDQDSETHALLVGANFMIHKPVDSDHARRCMRAAYGTMLQQRRRSARVSVDIPVVARVSDLGPFDARVSDLSVSGVAIDFTEPLPIGHDVSLVVNLPGTESLIRITGNIVNVNSAGRAGVRLSFVPDEDQSLLEKWLAAEMAKLESTELPAERPRGFSHDSALLQHNRALDAN